MKDIKISIKEGYGEITTETINGKLDALLINSPVKSQITILSVNGYQIFDFKEAEGFMYIPIRVQALDCYGHRINFSSDKISLNEKLIIKIQPIMKFKPLGEIKLILRIE